MTSRSAADHVQTTLGWIMAADVSLGRVEPDPKFGREFLEAVDRGTSAPPGAPFA